jgi:hypothetical protein
LPIGNTEFIVSTPAADLFPWPDAIIRCHVRDAVEAVLRLKQINIIPND